MKRPILTSLGAGLAAALLAAGAATAQSRCGALYEIQRGDTLYEIAQSCRVSLNRIMALNPALNNPHDIEVGAEIRLRPDSDGAIGRTTYRVQPGDTLYSIAVAHGVSLFELRRANPDVVPTDMPVGELINLPGDAPAASVSVEPTRVAATETVQLHAHNLRPHDWVTIGVGPRASEWRAIHQARTDARGMLDTQVEVPDWARPGDTLVFVVDTDRGMLLKSTVVDIVDRAGTPPITIWEGVVRRGVECQLLRTDDGETWALSGAPASLAEGERVRITGAPVEFSICMQGRGTIEVHETTELGAGPDEPSDGRWGAIPARYALGAWAPRGGDCRLPAFEIRRDSTGALVVETRMRGRMRQGLVALGPEPAFLFERPERTLPIERRGVDGLAVMPPENGRIGLGGARIAGDGRVFVRCG